MIRPTMQHGGQPISQKSCQNSGVQFGCMFCSVAVIFHVTCCGYPLRTMSILKNIVKAPRRTEGMLGRDLLGPFSSIVAHRTLLSLPHPISHYAHLSFVFLCLSPSPSLP
ncbi:hypothetical protein OH77DRAFT_1300645 [Trametes cingulata]|nr:hypothetical protein OH77DRAFT_1300645 [Trametes cingulata]